MAAVELNKYGFFNGVFGLEQANWADYWKGVIPDGVVANSGETNAIGGQKEMAVTAASGMSVYVAPGEVMVDNHKGWNMSRKTLTCDTAENLADPRIDSVIVRVRYGNDGESVMELDIKKGEPAVEPTARPLVQETGNVYEYRLANIYIDAYSSNIASNNIVDERYVFSMGAGSITPFAETLTYDDENQAVVDCVLNVVDGREYRCFDNATGNKITNELIVNLPTNPVSTFMCEIDFTSGSRIDPVTETEFTYKGVEFRRNNTKYNIKCTNMVVSNNARYNILIWWDGLYYWADCKMA